MIYQRDHDASSVSQRILIDKQFVMRKSLRRIVFKSLSDLCAADRATNTQYCRGSCADRDNLSNSRNEQTSYGRAQRPSTDRAHCPADDAAQGFANTAFLH